MNPGFFLEDFKFIRYLGNVVDTRQARADVLDFKDINRKRWRILHGSLRIVFQDGIRGLQIPSERKQCQRGWTSITRSVVVTKSEQ